MAFVYTETMFKKLLEVLTGNTTRSKAARGFIIGSAVGAAINKKPVEPYQGTISTHDFKNDIDGTWGTITRFDPPIEFPKEQNQ